MLAHLLRIIKLKQRSELFVTCRKYLQWNNRLYKSDKWQNVYIMTSPRLAPSRFSFFCFLSSMCFALLLPLQREKHSLEADVGRVTGFESVTLISAIPRLDLVLFVVFLM